jgi:uncharacterized protein (TIGR00299 family) protein
MKSSGPGQQRDFRERGELQNGELQIHLDLVGGIAGDMFIAALLDAFPQHEARVLESIAALAAAFPVECALLAHTDSIVRGSRFRVEVAARRAGAAHAGVLRVAAHAHRSWREIRDRLLEAPLNPGAREHALGIFRLLADAEAQVHGVAADEVTFHEVGAHDSIADVVGAAALIDALGAQRWTASPAPLGKGHVSTEHGLLPVPAPATALLLRGLPTIDDGFAGERVTPTGAAILRYLCPPEEHPRSLPAEVRTLTATGTGFGARAIPGLSNHLRVLCFAAVDPARGGHRLIHVLEFEIDDQSGEDLATGLDRLRAHRGVLDVTHAPVFGKKGRMMAQVRVLARHAARDEVIEACFRETTTIGLRHRVVEGIGLERWTTDVSVEGQRLRVKLVTRPGGATAKAEADDVLAHAGHSRRAFLRRAAENQALAEIGGGSEGGVASHAS